MTKSTNVSYGMRQWDKHVKLFRTILNGQSKCVFVYIILIYLVPSKPLPVTKEVRELF